MSLTLEAIEAKQAELAKMIAQFKTTPAPTRVAFSAELALAAGERYAGIILGDGGTISHHLVLLPGEAEDIAWQDAVQWAEQAGGELPSRREQALLFANAKSEFTAAWYWSAESHEGDGSYAWGQHFNYGNHYGSHKSYEGRCRAVRRIPA